MIPSRSIMPQKENIQQMFDSIAPGYDAFNHLTSLGADRAWRRRALREVVGPRVLRPGGRFVMLELGIPRNPIIRAVYKFYFTRIMPLVGAGISKDKAAYKYLPASVLNFPKPEDWTATMQKAGLAEVRHRPLTLGICNLFTGLRPA